MNGGEWSSARRRIMVVADPGSQAAGALEWALFHAVAEHGEVVLLHVELPEVRRWASGTFSSFLRRPAPPPEVRSSSSLPAQATGPAPYEDGGKNEYEFLDAMRSMCESVHPKVRVQVERVEMQDKDKAAAILAQTKLLRVDLVVVSQRQSSGAFKG